MCVRDLASAMYSDVRSQWAYRRMDNGCAITHAMRTLDGIPPKLLYLMTLRQVHTIGMAPVP